MAEPLDPVALAPHYRSFLRPDRILLTGHSHQAWPDRALDGLLEAFEDAAARVDDKWERAGRVADDVRGAVASRIGASPGEIALGPSTHELVVRFLSALDWRRKRHLVTTRGEFHSLWRQLRRVAEEGVEVSFVDPEPLESLASRLASAIRPGATAAVLVSTVLFETSAVVPGLRETVEAAHRAGAEVLLDAYHAFGVVPFSIAELGPDPIFVTAGGYKYAQWGEGCCFLRVPPDCALRPVVTGWFADFESLAEGRDVGSTRRPVRYGAAGAERFAGSTYDPTSHYRARAVIRFFAEQGLDLGRLRELSLRQTARILDGLEGYDVATPREPTRRGGFVSVRLARAAEVVQRLHAEGIRVDARGELVRLGPAPYLTDDEIDRGVTALRAASERS